MDCFDMRLWPDFEKLVFNRAPIKCSMIDQVVIDSRRIDSKDALFVALQGACDGHDFVVDAFKAGAKYAIVRRDWQASPLVKEEALLRVESPLKALQSLACCYRKAIGVTTVAICGSYGKTMCKDLLYAMLSRQYKVAASPESFNSQIGVALSLFQVKSEHNFAIVEAAISKVGEMQNLVEMIAPNAAILTHIGKKHLATLGNRATTAQEIAKLLKAVNEKSFILLPQDEQLKAHYSAIKATMHFWDAPHPTLPDVCQHPIKESYAPYTLYFPDGAQFFGQVKAEFSYFQDLLNITTKAAWLLGADKEAITAALTDYTPEPMRTEIWKAPMGATFVSDTYCSDPQSVDLALRFYDQALKGARKVFVFGGMRAGPFPLSTAYRRVGKALHAAGIDLLVLYGQESFEALVDELKRLSPDSVVYKCIDEQAALNLLEEKALPSDYIVAKGPNKIALERFIDIFNDGPCNNLSLINFEAIKENIALIKQKLPVGTKVMAAVKAFAYGTGDLAMAKFLARCGIDMLCLSTPDEAIALRRAGVNLSLFVINAAYYEAAKVVKWQLDVAVSTKEEIKALALEAQNKGKKVKVHLHVDTGMNRFGCRQAEALLLAKEIVKYPQLIFDGIMTHFATAESEADDAFTLEQARQFDAVIAGLKSLNIDPQWKHAANSAAAVRFYMPQYNMVRIGLALYGLYASQSAKEALELRQGVSLISRLVGINTCHAGQSVSYGRSYTVSRPKERIGVLPVGYFDGLHRNYSGRGEVIIRGKRAKMVGKICMDFMMVDVTDIPEASVGDSVLIFGEDAYGNYLDPQELASRGDTIVHQLITCLGPRIQRVFIHEESK